MTDMFEESGPYAQIEQLQFKIARLQAAYDSRGGEMDSMRMVLAETQKWNEERLAEIERLRSSPTTGETDELIKRLVALANSLGGDDETVIMEAIEALHRLARNQITTSYRTVAQAAALQAQEADAQMRRAEALDAKCTQFTEALLKAMTLIDELMRENGRLCAASDTPPSVRLFAAKASWDTAMHRLLGDTGDTGDTEDDPPREVESDTPTEEEGEAR